MATVTILNLTASPVYVSDIYTSVPANASLDITRSVSDLSRMAALQSLIAAGSLSAAVTYSADEKASGLIDVGTTASAATGIGDEDIIRVPFAAGVAGTADDVTVYALNSLPYKKLRILDAWAIVATAIGGTTLQVRTQSGGAGTLCAEMSSASTGRAGETATVTASQAITSGASVGLFVRRSDRGVAGEVFIKVRPET